jgi:hypothetical protein
MRQIKRGHVDVDGIEWASITKKAKEFVLLLLEFNPSIDYT